jgi:hypothetical protein
MFLQPGDFLGDSVDAGDIVAQGVERPTASTVNSAQQMMSAIWRIGSRSLSPRTG